MDFSFVPRGTRGAAGRVGEPAVSGKLQSRDIYMPFRGAASTRAMRTLLVEDNPRECQAMAQSLSRAGFKADCANSAGGALAKVELDSKPVAAIVDLKLPDGSGCCRV